MRPVLGVSLGGGAFLGAAERSRLGAPHWGAAALLRDLELRAGVPTAELSRSVRVPRFAASLRELGDRDAFYAASFECDPLGTADAILAWRDTLVEAGWDGRKIDGGGPRLEAVARIEALGIVPLGGADRLATIARRVRRMPAAIYDELQMVEDEACWPGAWREIFAALRATGTTLARREVDLPGAPRSTDLGRLQAALVGEAVESDARGDGSLVLLRGETEVELGGLTAAVIAESPSGCLVVRGGDAATLDAALVAHGLPSQGVTSKSACRPSMQVLPLAIELAFEPRDPYRALELLTLPVGPFRGVVGSRLARAIARAPGIGGREWIARRAEARELVRSREMTRLVAAGTPAADAEERAEEYAATRMRRVAEWLEAPTLDPRRARRSEIQAIVARVRTWLLTRMDEDHATYGPAFAQAHAFAEALANDGRERLSREEVRQLLDTLVRASDDHERVVEAAGRVAHVGHPSAIFAPCRSLVWWRFAGGAELRPPRSPWSTGELAALASAGVRFADPLAEIAAESASWRRAIIAARERVVFVAPSTIDGQHVGAHPLWDEIVARLRLIPASEAMLTLRADHVLGGRAPFVTVEEVEPLPLPDPPALWRLPAGTIAVSDVTAGSATALDTLVTCPLRWVLERCADIRRGAVARVADGPVLSGTLGHRLVEELFEHGAFDIEESVFAARARAALEVLLRTEGATLLLPGTTFERSQLVPQLLRAVRELHRWLRRSGYRIVAVEEPVEVSWVIGRLTGRLDVRLAHPEIGAAILDLKWGESRYRDVIREGRAIQLAVYASAIASGGVLAMPPAGYFALRSGRVLASDARMQATLPLDGSSLDTTWAKAERTALAVVQSLEAGAVPVAGHRRAAPLLDALAVPDAERSVHYEPTRDGACTYCSFDALCGRAWDGSR